MPESTPPRILAIDTSLEDCAVAIAAGSRVAIVRETIGRGHAERLFGMVEAALAEAGLRLGDIDRFAVTTGPGSFTGIRVGVAAARGFALATGRPAFGISTLAAHAAEARAMAGRVSVLAVLPAKGGEAFAQLFLADGSSAGLPEAAQHAALAILAFDAGAVLAGAGADAVAAAWPSFPAPEIVHCRSAPDIRTVLDLASFAGPEASPPRPLYIRPPDAAPATGFAVARR